MAQLKRIKHAYDITQNLSGIANNALKKVNKTANKVQKKVTQYSEPVEQYLERHPLRSIGFAVAIGFLLTQFIRAIHK